MKYELKQLLAADLYLVVEVHEYGNRDYRKCDYVVGDWRLELHRDGSTVEPHPALKRMIRDELMDRGVEAFGLLGVLATHIGAEDSSAAQMLREAS